MLTITVLYDNVAHDARLQTDWGLACLVEGLEQPLLFDTGGKGDILLRNMRALGLDPQAVRTVVLSHAHGDHTGGWRDSWPKILTSPSICSPPSPPGSKTPFGKPARHWWK